jgi:holliday junction DNA helicase RuvB
MKDQRETAPEAIYERDEELDSTLRPRKFRDYIGQESLKETLAIAIQAASSRGESVDHLLFHGPPGLGKTTLAHVIAAETGRGLRVTSGPALERPGDLAAIITNLEEGEILFIDEIHRLNRQIEEVLYSAMEDFALDLVVGKGPGARSIRLELPRFTLLGATTRFGELSSPLRDRFGIVERLDFYTPEEIERIVKRSARILKLELEKDAAREIAGRARMTPRVANRLLKRVRDYAEVKRKVPVDAVTAREALDQLHIDELGLDRADRELLGLIIKNYKGGPVGLSTLAAATRSEPITIEEVHEPYLLQAGLLERTAKGRRVTAAAYAHLGIAPPASAQEKLI